MKSLKKWFLSFLSVGFTSLILKRLKQLLVLANEKKIEVFFV